MFRNSGSFLLAVGFLTATAVPVGAATLVEEDFSSEPPEWQSFGMGPAAGSDFGYNSNSAAQSDDGAAGLVGEPGSSSNAGTFVGDGTWSMYYTPLGGVVTDEQSFTVNADVQSPSTAGTTGASEFVGLFNTNESEPQTNGIAIDRHVVGNRHKARGLLFDDQGDEHSTNRVVLKGTREYDTWNRMHVDYDAGTREMTFSVDNVRGSEFSDSITLAEDTSFRTNALGISNKPRDNADRVIDARADNVSLEGEVVPEPASLAVFALGAIGLASTRSSRRQRT